MISRRLIVTNVIVVCTLLAAWAGRTPETATGQSDYMRHLSCPYLNWRSSDVGLSATDTALLHPDAYLVRNYRSPAGTVAQLAVVVGHDKRSVHTPAFCMTGGGWQTILQRHVRIILPDRSVPAIETVFSQGDGYLLTTYFFTDGDYCTDGLMQFQWRQLIGRLRGQPTFGALVRISVPMAGDQRAAEHRTQDFARAVLPTVLNTLRTHRSQS